MSYSIPLNIQAQQLFQAGQLQQVIEVCWQILSRNPLDPEAIYLLGAAALQSGRTDESIMMLHHATVLDPNSPLALHALGEAWRIRGDLDRAESCFRAALQIKPDLVNSRHSLGLILLDRKQHEDAEKVLREVIAIDPRHERAHMNLGRALQAAGKSEEAIEEFREAIRLRPDYAQALNNLGATLQGMDRAAESLEPLRKAVQLNPKDAITRGNFGHALLAAADPAAARDQYLQALAIKPDYVRAQAGLGRAYESMGHLAEACDAWEKATRLDPNDANAFERLGDLLMLKPDWSGAYKAFAKSSLLQPNSDSTYARLSYARQIACDWQDRDAMIARLRAEAAKRLEKGEATAVVPFQALTLPMTPQEQLAIAASHSKWADKLAEPLIKSLERKPRSNADGKTRVGYLSGDFQAHPIAYLIQGLFELHDRSRFEVVGYSIGPADTGVHRKRIAAGCDKFRDIRELSSLAVARQIMDDQVDILVDLMGYTGSHRTGIFALRPAEVQVSFLGMVGSMGASFIDYLIADDIVIPPGSEGDYTEKIVIMPDTYMITDNSRSVGPCRSTRSQCGLPENGVVLCCFNNGYKIEPSVFDDWMTILREVPDAVLWLYAPDIMTAKNLNRETIARKIDPKRVIFTGHVPLDEYLARHALADLFLDTPLYNGHSTVALSLWAGLPVLTRPGSTFASRVATSLLHSAGLPEMSVPDAEAYRAKAIALCRDPNLRKSLAEKLKKNRESAPLFATQAFVKHLESAYKTMHERNLAGEKPAAFRLKK